MNAPTSKLAERKAQYQEAQTLRREQAKSLWLSVKDKAPFDDHHFRRMFAFEILTNNPDLQPHVGEFLGKTMVDRNSYSQKQKDWLVRLVEDYLGIAQPKPEPKPKNKQGTGK